MDDAMDWQLNFCNFQSWEIFNGNFIILGPKFCAFCLEFSF